MSLCENYCRIPEMKRFQSTKGRHQSLPETKKAHITEMKGNLKLFSA